MIRFKENHIPSAQKTIELYRSVGWGHTKCPNSLNQAIKKSDFVVTAWDGDKLIGLGRAISDSALTVYFPDILVHPNWQRKKIGTEIMKRLLGKYGNFHNQVFIAEDKIAKQFYKKFGFVEETSALSITKPFQPE